MTAIICTWIVVSFIAGPIVGCLIAGRSGWSMLERSHHEAIGSDWPRN